MYIKIFISFLEILKKCQKVCSGIKFHRKNGIFFLGGGGGVGGLVVVKLSTRWLMVLESLWQRRPNDHALFAAFINAYIYNIWNIVLWRYFRTRDVIPHACRRWLTTSEKASKGGMVAKTLLSIKSLVRFPLKLNSSLRQYWRMSWTFFQRNWTRFFLRSI